MTDTKISTIVTWEDWSNLLITTNDILAVEMKSEKHPLVVLIQCFSNAFLSEYHYYNSQKYIDKPLGPKCQYAFNKILQWCDTNHSNKCLH